MELHLQLCNFNLFYPNIFASSEVSGFQTYNNGVDDGWGKKRLQSIFHQKSSPVHQGPVL